MFLYNNIELIFVWNRESLDQLFLAAPFVEYFEGEDMLVAHSALQELYNAVTTRVPDDPDPGGVIFPDDIVEVEWKIRRQSSPAWTVVWSLLSRSKLRPQNLSQIGVMYRPFPLFDVTEIVPGAIVYCTNEMEGNPSHIMKTFLTERYVYFMLITHYYCLC